MGYAEHMIPNTIAKVQYYPPYFSFIGGGVFSYHYLICVCACKKECEKHWR